MINHGLFKNVHLDTHKNCLVFIDVPQHQQNVTPKAPTPPVSYVTVQCNGCGAPNKIAADAVEECEFCGSPISVK